MCRWFVLDGCELRYFESSSAKTAKGIIDLSGAGRGFLTHTVVTGDGMKPPPTSHTLTVNTPSRQFKMAFHSAADAAMWSTRLVEIEDSLFGEKALRSLLLFLYLPRSRFPLCVLLFTTFSYRFVSAFVSLFPSLKISVCISFISFSLHFFLAILLLPLPLFHSYLP